MSKYGFNTKCLQSGYDPKNGEPRILPIFQSTTFRYESADEVAALFDLAKEGHMYSRISNPTVAAFEEKISDLEGGVGALATSSGQSASLIAILTICNNGEHFIAPNNIYGGSFTLFSSTLAKFGISASFFSKDASDEEIESLIKPETKLIFTESLSNPGVDVLDLERFVNLAHKNGLPLIVDNTLATPYLLRPIEHGADIVIHSSTKYIDGHATSVGGVVVDSGNFDWTNGKFPHLTEKDPNYHGLSYTETFGEAAYIVKARAVFMRDLGTCLSPFNAFLMNLGTETLPVRMDRHSENALAVAEFLESHPKVEWVKYPFLKSSPSYENAVKYLKAGSGVISFGVKGGIEEGKKFIDNLKLTALIVHVGDIRTCALHPGSMTHRQLSEEDQIKAGITPNLIRLSVGLENIEDILEDIEKALEAI
ncbi:O-acetylhomoserine aminocarboxypropyltransferase/cysteine synthase family protein [Microaceticoccus formicicus]|uniref:O-acetylhomoserine aminocarboxypropyltransferase/cysteine synthase family protein n=1 Tax=Microaceticoccus formicicus TaxID=3118105 RepID=UPI003CD0400F|nr:O-acetylhomoserine aminocarboxypropyltransferase/cysteine synthase family protein [Peptoniphilaceae bacterium AMB_02]